MAIELSEKQIKDGWQIVKFGEIAKNISKRVEPSETNLEVYVGLEHLDPQSLRITRRGVPADVKGQKLRVRPGQIIFGKRRAYQKKVAVADFEGICSAHAMVLEEVVGKIIPGLLPFFMQSDMFMDRAVAISEGSLSPTIKWKTLAIQEFPLPPIERQKEIFEVLEKVDFSIHKSKLLELASEQLLKSTIISTELRLKAIKLSNCCRIRTGKKDVNEGNPDGKYPFYTCAKNITYSDVYSFDTEAILISGNGAGVGYTHYHNGKFEAYQRTYVLDEFCDVDPLFLKYYLDIFLQKHIDLEKHEGAIPYIKLGTLQGFDIPDLDIQEQVKIRNILEQENTVISLLQRKKSYFHDLKQGFVNFNGGVQ